MVSDSAGGAILAWPDGRNGPCEFSVVTPQCDVYAQRTRTASFPSPGCGDANDDGSLTALDALIALNAAIGLSSCEPSRCDVDDDQTITAPTLWPS